MGDLALMFWLGFFWGFWACVLVHVYYSIGRQWGRKRATAGTPPLQRGAWHRVWRRFRLN